MGGIAIVALGGVLLMLPATWDEPLRSPPTTIISDRSCAGREAGEHLPLSSAVAIDLVPATPGGIPGYVRSLVETWSGSGKVPLDGRFPLENETMATLRVLPGLRTDVVVSWMDPITGLPNGPRFGANNDYIAWFGDGWDADWTGDIVGSAPQFNGSPDAGWMWVNHEYVSNDGPQVGAAPNGQHLTLARHLVRQGVLDLDVTSGTGWDRPALDVYVEAQREQVGGSWIRVLRSPGSGRWTLVRHPYARRFDATDDTLLMLAGYRPIEPDHLDDGRPVPETGVVTGIANDCSGATTPWGTVISAEENVQDSWGDFETGWRGNQFKIGDPVWGAGGKIDLGPGGSALASTSSDFGRTSVAPRRHNRDLFGFLVEMDPPQSPGRYYRSARHGGDGTGHRKLGVMGRGPWENATIVVGPDYRLIPGNPVVVYGGHDRLNGRIYKFVSARPYLAGMTRAEVRSLLDEGSLYVAHFEDLDVRTGLTRFDPANLDCDDGVAYSDVPELLEHCTRFTETMPGTGHWIRLSVDNETDTPPNAAALGSGTRVGEALRDTQWNGIGGFPDDNTVLGALFTASAKIGASELNRPEDVEWNPVSRRLFVALTKHGRKVGLKQDGTLARAASGSTVETARRVDDLGSIWTLVESNPDNPAVSDSFSFWPVWFGSRGDGPFDAANPDNLLIDRDGGLWFATDGNLSTNGTADALYYLDLDETHRQDESGIAFPTLGRAFRVAAGPADSEVAGPAFNADMNTLFLSVQHPGEYVESDWPANRQAGCP